MNQQHSTHTGIAAVLAMAMALGPLALDTYLPAFPAIATSLAISVHQVSLTISIYIFVLAFGQLFGGPLSDRFGRQKVMLAGMAIFALSSLALAFAQSLNQFLVLRAIQAFGGGWAIVTVPALVRDRLSGLEAAKFFSLLGLLMVLAPAVAPTIGSLILSMKSWQSIFIFLSVYALVTLILLKRFVFKNKSQPISHDKMNVWQRYRSVATHRPAMRFMFIGSFAFSVLMLFITHSSFIYQQHFGVSTLAFSGLFAANVGLMLILNLLNRRLLDKYTSQQIVRWSLSAQGVGIVFLCCVTTLNGPLWLFVIAMVITVGVLGAASPNIQACYMEYFDKNGGTAAAMMGATQFSLGGLITAASALLPESVLAIVLSQAGCSIICLLLVYRKNSRTE